MIIKQQPFQISSLVCGGMLTRIISQSLFRPMRIVSKPAVVFNISFAGRSFSTDQPNQKPRLFRQLFRRPDGSLHYLPSFSVPIERVLTRSIFPDIDIARLVAKSASFAIYSFVGITILGTFGVDTKPFITGLGITGFTIGFALKDIATNFLSGLMLMTQKPFKNGDKVKVVGLEGTVDTVDVRYVILRNPTGKVWIPSSTVYSNPVVVEKSSTAPVRSEILKNGTS